MSGINSIKSRQRQSTKLSDRIGKTFIIASSEVTQNLEQALNQTGLSCEVLRQEKREEFANFSRSYLCLMNHCRAWENALHQQKPTLIVEADFVPVIGFGALPLPFNSDRQDTGIAWLYTCAPQLYSISEEGYAEGFSTSTVAYIVTAEGARHLLDLAETVRSTFGTAHYSTWDSQIDSFLRTRKLKNYIPFRNYGEHGGLPNPEHRKHGLSGIHRADTLYGKLAFLPLYADSKGGKSRLLIERLRARLKGVGRLATGRFVRLPVLQGSSMPMKLISFAVRRQLLP